MKHEYDQVEVPADIVKLALKRCRYAVAHASLRYAVGDDFMQTVLISAYIQGLNDALETIKRLGLPPNAQGVSPAEGTPNTRPK